MNNGTQTPAQRDAQTVRQLSKATGLTVSQIRHSLRDYARQIQQEQRTVRAQEVQGPPPSLPAFAPSVQSFSPRPFRLSEKVGGEGNAPDELVLPKPTDDAKYVLGYDAKVLVLFPTDTCPDE